MYLELRNLLIHIVLEQIAEPLLVSHSQSPELLLEDLLVEKVAHTETTPGHLGAVRWTNSLPCGAYFLESALQPSQFHSSMMMLTNVASTEFHLFQAIHQLMHIEDNMSPIRDVYPSLGIQPMLLQRLQFLEEAGHMNDTATSNDIDASRVHKAAGENVKVVGDAVCDNRVPGIVTALGATAYLRFVGEDIGELALAFVAPLSAEDNGDGHAEEKKDKRESQDGLQRAVGG
jgi:hypothetical protein